MFSFFKKNKGFNFIGLHKIMFCVSAILILISFVSFFINKLNFGIDFTGGLLFDISVNNNNDIAGLRGDFLNKGFNDFNVQSYGKQGFIIRISEKEVSKYEKKELSNSESIQVVKNIINSYFNNEINYNKIDFVGPQVGEELITKGILALVLSLIVIVLYIWIRFEFEFGMGALITLFHDVIIVFGMYSLFKVEFDLTAIAAILTIVGYSVNDTVVIYDRIREYLIKYKNEKYPEIINKSLQTTFRRTLLTSSTTLLGLLILGLIGGESIKSFSLMVFFGIIIGTYSSIFISAPILLYIGKKK